MPTVSRTRGIWLGKIPPSILTGPANSMGPWSLLPIISVLGNKKPPVLPVPLGAHYGPRAVAHTHVTVWAIYYPVHTPIVHRIGRQGGFTLAQEQGVEPFAGVGRSLGCHPWSGDPGVITRGGSRREKRKRKEAPKHAHTMWCV